MINHLLLLPIAMINLVAAVADVDQSLCYRLTLLLLLLMSINLSAIDRSITCHFCCCC
jgi:hypothetical protein